MRLLSQKVPRSRKPPFPHLSYQKLHVIKLDYKYEIEYKYGFQISMKPVTFPKPSLFILVLGREGSREGGSGDEMQICLACVRTVRTQLV